MSEEELKQLGVDIARIENFVIHINNYLRSLQKQNEMALQVIEKIKNGSGLDNDALEWIKKLFHTRATTLHDSIDLIINAERNCKPKEKK